VRASRAGARHGRARSNTRGVNHDDREWVSVLPSVSAPVLLVLASHGAVHAFTACLASLSSRHRRRQIARWLAQTSPLGARLDSWGDLLRYSRCGLRRAAASRVRPPRRLVRRRRRQRFRPVASGSSASAADELSHARREAAAYLLRRKHAGSHSPRSGWPFRIATQRSCAGGEEIAITRLTVWRANVRSSSCAVLRRAAR